MGLVSFRKSCFPVSTRVFSAPARDSRRSNHKKGNGMNYGKLSIATLILALPALAPAASFGLDDTHASARLQSDVAHLHPGSDLTFKVVLDDPLPTGAYFQVRLSPVKVDQELPVASGEPVDKGRKEFLLHTKLPDGSVPGDWHIKVVCLFLYGTSWITP
jgi:hypothetical protein